MNQPQPTVEEFLAQQEPDDDTDQIDPLEKIAEGVQQLVEHFTTVRHRRNGPVITNIDDSAERYETLNALLRNTNEELADLEAKHGVVLQVIADVEAALGKSKAAPALAAKAVIDAYKNPQVPEPVEDEPRGLSAEDQAEIESLLEQPSVEGHSRTPYEDGQGNSGPDFCRECSAEAQDWVEWPCPTVTAVYDPTGLEEGHEEVQQPAHDAPVEAWREYARSKGFAGPEIDKANRSQIRTSLGIAQPVPGA